MGRIAQVNTDAEYFLGDALGSVRQLTDTSGTITYARAYDPYGMVKSTTGSSQSTYGFTGEVYGDSTQLTYLRSRFYASGTGRFLTRDTWSGDYNRPLSLNRWLYVEGNPVNFDDPSGLAPCMERGGGRYCVLNEGGYLDMAHFRTGKDMGAYLLKELGRQKRFGKLESPLPVSQPFFGPLSYSLTYRTSIPAEGLSESVTKQMALGIFMDFQIRYEFRQGADPRCYISPLDNIVPHCSYFSNEDLISDYLGFASYMREMNLAFILEVLGGGVASDTPPTGYHPINTKFTSFRLMVNDCGSINIVRKTLPSTLLMDTPLEAGQFWDVPESYDRINLSVWLK